MRKSDRMSEEEVSNREYRQHMKARMRECINDAQEVLKEEGIISNNNDMADTFNITKVAVALFDKRVSPKYYWQQKHSG